MSRVPHVAYSLYRRMIAAVLSVAAVLCLSGVASADPNTLYTGAPPAALDVVVNFGPWALLYMTGAIAGIVTVLAPKLSWRVLQKSIGFFFKNGMTPSK